MTTPVQIQVITQILKKMPNRKSMVEQVFNGQVGNATYLYDAATGLPIPGGGGLVLLTDVGVIANIIDDDNWTGDPKTYTGPVDTLSDNHYYIDGFNYFYLKIGGEWQSWKLNDRV